MNGPASTMSHNPSDPHVVDFGLDVSESFERAGSDVQSVAAPAPRAVPAFVEQFAATIRSKPCATNVTSDYPDARYFLDRAIATSDGSTPLATQVDALPGVAQCLTATNLAELAAGTHLLAAGAVVQVFALYTRAGRKLYVFNQPPPDGAIVLITGPAAGGGKYVGQVLGGTSSAVASGTLAMPEGLTAGDDALILNEEETGLNGHRIAPGAFAVGRVAGRSNGTVIVVIRGAAGATAGATALGDGTGGSVGAQGTSWSKAADGTPVDLWVQTRTVWDSSTGTLLAYVRKVSFDARGVLYAISGENSVTVDVATACG
jgi:hypothetical protein